MLKAKDRAVKYIPPSSKGGIKDCIIYEHALELLRILKLQGFTYPKIFLTSNTKDFCGENKRPKPPIDTEMNYPAASYGVSNRQIRRQYRSKLRGIRPQ